MPAFRHDIRYGGATPITVAPYRSANRHCASRSGHVGSPSTSTIEARSSSPDTSVFHIIQARRREPLESRAGLQILDDTLVLVLLDQLSSVTVDDRLGLSVAPEENSA